MDPADRFIILSYDEMLINRQLEYDKRSEKLQGRVTLGKKLLLG